MMKNSKNYFTQWNVIHAVPFSELTLLMMYFIFMTLVILKLPSGWILNKLIAPRNMQKHFHHLLDKKPMNSQCIKQITYYHHQSKLIRFWWSKFLYYSKYFIVFSLGNKTWILPTFSVISFWPGLGKQKTNFLIWLQIVP